jgi:DNA-binding NtrC family response regulator
MRARHLAGWQSSTRIAGQSPDTVRLRSEISRVALFNSNVLVTGPSGSGKELVARQIHEQSGRAHQPFIPVDCAAMTGELMSSQLFGHVAGAFTGANCDALGCFRAANLGTLFLDEIGELEFSLQAKLLRVLQDHVVTPVGSHVGERVDVRVIAATNRDLPTEVLAGRFREDLYYRLHVAHLKTIPLQDRLEDIDELADTILEELAEEGLPRCSLSPAAIDALMDFQWPGNVRQLRNVLEQAVIDSESAIISEEPVRGIISISFPRPSEPAIAGSRPAAADNDGILDADCQEWGGIKDHPATDGQVTADRQAAPQSRDSTWLTLGPLERDHIAHTLEHTFHNRSAAARLLGVTRQSLLRKMKHYGLDCEVARSR